MAFCLDAIRAGGASKVDQAKLETFQVALLKSMESEGTYLCLALFFDVLSSFFFTCFHHLICLISGFGNRGVRRHGKRMNEQDRLLDKTFELLRIVLADLGRFGKQRVRSMCPVVFCFSLCTVCIVSFVSSCLLVVQSCTTTTLIHPSPTFILSSHLHPLASALIRSHSPSSAVRIPRSPRTEKHEQNVQASYGGS